MDSECGKRQLPWSPMDSSVWIRGWWSVSTAGNGCNGMPWTLDQVKYLFFSVDDWDEKC